MKRDDKLAAEILKLLSDSEFKSLHTTSIAKSIGNGDATKAALIDHHLRILQDRGFISISDGAHARLTWEGHDIAEGHSVLDQNKSPRSFR